MRRSGFTMIELIFVIVILGILASVAIPKLAATRDDARIAAAATAIGVAVSEVSAYYTAKGEFNTTSPVQMSNSLADSSYWRINTTGTSSVPGTITANYIVNGADCISLIIGGGDVNVTRLTNNDSVICDQVSDNAPDRNTTIGGSGVVY